MSFADVALWDASVPVTSYPHSYNYPNVIGLSSWVLVVSVFCLLSVPYLEKLDFCLRLPRKSVMERLDPVWFDLYLESLFHRSHPYLWVIPL